MAPKVLNVKACIRLRLFRIFTNLQSSFPCIFIGVDDPSGIAQPSGFAARASAMCLSEMIPQLHGIRNVGKFCCMPGENESRRPYFILLFELGGWSSACSQDVEEEAHIVISSSPALCWRYVDQNSDRTLMAFGRDS